MPRPSSRPVVLLAALVALGAVVLPAGAAAPPVELTRVTLPSGLEIPEGSSRPALSGDGQLLVFASASPGLVAGDTNGLPDVFVRDRRTGVTTRISVSSTGAQARGDSRAASISGDGQVVAFWSSADDLVDGDTNVGWDVFAHDLVSGTTTRVSVSTGGGQGTGDTWSPRPLLALSADGGRVAFASQARGLVPDDTDDARDVFVHDRVRVVTTRENLDEQGATIPWSEVPTLSADGLTLAFHGAQVGLPSQAYVRDLSAGRTAVASVRPDGTRGLAGSTGPALSGDAEVVAFWSSDDQLASGAHTDGGPNLFVRELATGATRRVEGFIRPPSFFGPDLPASLSHDGSFLVFAALRQDEAPTPGGRYLDVFRSDLRSGTTSLLSVPGSAAADGTAVSSDGQVAAFEADGRLVAGDTNSARDVFVVAPQPDRTPPVLTPVVTPAVPTGSEGWWTGDVSLSWTTVDEESEIGSGDGCLPVTVTVDQGPTDYPCQATSEGGTANQIVTLKRDATPPTGSALVGGPAPGVGYSPGSVPVAPTCTAADATSGVASCVVTGWSGALGSHRLTSVATDRAGNQTTVVWPAYSVADPGVVPPPTPPADPPADPPVVTAAAAVPAAVTLSTSRSVTAGNAPRVTGVVTDAAGAPLGGVPVVVQSIVYGGTGWTDVETVRTDAQGRYALLVRPTKHTLYGATVRTPTGELHPARPVAVEVAARMGLLAPLPGAVDVTVPRATVLRGTLLPAYAGVAVGVAERWVRPDGSVAFTVLAQRDTGPDGSWAVPVTLTPGRHVLVAFTSPHAGTSSGSTSRTVLAR